ncbi:MULTISPECIES: hypothetical protein [Herbaspirillum]|uniref:Uncharacterized protein n=2 Tax=Herbaspirillum huttiense TaxID=863372 RepID=A0AAJ2LTY6_9BURK|nr:MULTISPECIES: hypothetical protein [Herbaspirillum]MDR9836810.1 hypothetical protein [Herbaspirillum huttiense]
MGYFAKLNSYTNSKSTDMAAVGAACYLVAFVTLFSTGALWAFCALLAFGMIFGRPYLRDTIPVMMSVAIHGKWPVAPGNPVRSNPEETDPSKPRKD